MAVLLACAALLFVRAREALAERAEIARRRPAKQRSRSVVEPRQESLGDRGPIVLPYGSAWSSGSSADVVSLVHGGPPSALLALFAGCGIIMSLTGTAVLTRVPR